MANNSKHAQPEDELDSFFENGEESQDKQPENDFNISWKASEYVHHKKPALWFVGLGVVTLVLAVALFFILRDISIIVLLVVMAAAIYVYANRQPRTLDYSLNSVGLTIGKALYRFASFRSFSIMQENGLYSIELDPLQRFRPSISIYFAAQDGEKIIDILSSFLPVEEKRLDYIDRFVRAIKF